MSGAAEAGYEPQMAASPGGLKAFEATLSNCFFPYEIESARGIESFESASATRSIGALKLFRIAVGNAFTGHRLRAGRCGERNSYVLSLVEEGEVHYRGRRAACAGAGDLILMNSDHALDSQRTVAGQTLAVSIPAAMLRVHFSEADDWCLIPLPTHESSPAILRECLKTYWRTQQSATESGYHDLAQAIIHLIGACFRQPLGRVAMDSRSMHAHWLRVCAVVEEHLLDPELSAALVADRLGISKSYLFAVMNAADTTLGRLIREQRLERSAKLLGDPAMRSRSIAELAFAVGFQDPAHFSRRFTEKFGRSPRAFRAGAQAASRNSTSG